MGVKDKIQGKEYLLQDLWNLLREGLHRLIQVLRLAAEEWDYLREPRNAESLKLLKKELFRVLSAILPKKGKGFIRIGLSDPYQTGRLMEAAALLYPVYGKQKVDVIPEFSESVLVKINKIWSRNRLFFAFHRNFAQLDQLIDDGVDGETTGRMDLQLSGDVAAMRNDRMRGDAEAVGYLAVRHALDDADDNLFFPRTEVLGFVLVRFFFVRSVEEGLELLFDFVEIVIKRNIVVELFDKLVGNDGGEERDAFQL